MRWRLLTLPTPLPPRPASSGICSRIKTPENVSRFENIEELLNGIKDFTDDDEREGDMNLGDYLQEVTLMTDADNEKDEDRNKVTIMTIHSAKGLEFKHLVIAGVEEELFPSQMSIDNPKDLEEERRLFYVALTRAEKSAIITYAALGTNGAFRMPVPPAALSRKSIRSSWSFLPILTGASGERTCFA